MARSYNVTYTVYLYLLLMWNIPLREFQLNRQLARMGIKKALEKAGVKPGDKVRCGNLEWEWF